MVTLILILIDISYIELRWQVYTDNQRAEAGARASNRILKAESWAELSKICFTNKSFSMVVGEVRCC